MPLHERDNVRLLLRDSVFAGHALTSAIPKYRFPKDETLPREAFQLVADEMMLDGNARQNLATFCQTWEEPEVVELMALSMNKNLIDADEYPQTAEMERRSRRVVRAQSMTPLREVAGFGSGVDDDRDDQRAAPVGPVGPRCHGLADQLLGLLDVDAFL